MISVRGVINSPKWFLMIATFWYSFRDMETLNKWGAVIDEAEEILDKELAIEAEINQILKEK